MTDDLWVESGAVVGSPHPGGRRSRLVRARALRRHSEHDRRRDLAESSLSLARASPRTHHVHRGSISFLRVADRSRARKSLPIARRWRSATTPACCTRDRDIVLSVVFQLDPRRPRRNAPHHAGEPELARRASTRGSSYYPSAGSIFKKIDRRRCRPTHRAGGPQGLSDTATRRSHTFTPTSSSTSAHATAADVRALIGIAQDAVCTEMSGKTSSRRSGSSGSSNCGQRRAWATTTTPDHGGQGRRHASPAVGEITHGTRALGRRRVKGGNAALQGDAWRRPYSAAPKRNTG